MASERPTTGVLFKWLRWCVLLLCASATVAAAPLQEKGSKEYLTEEMSAPVVVDGATLRVFLGSLARSIDKRYRLKRLVSQLPGRPAHPGY